MATPEPIRGPILEPALPSNPDTECAILGAIISSGGFEVDVEGLRADAGTTATNVVSIAENE